MTASAEPGHLAPELIRVPAVPPVTDDEDDCAVSQDASGVHPLKRVQRIGDAGAAADVVHLLGDVIEC